MNAPALNVTRPPARWHGGKFAMADRLIAFFPPHRAYTEAFGGAAGVLLQKPRAHEEIYNDLDDDIVNLFRVLQDPQTEARLLDLLRVTPFARREFEIAYDPADEPIERARRLIIRSFMGFGSNAHALTNRGHQSTGFRSKSNRSGTTPAQDWWHLPDTLPAVAERMRGVVIEHRDAFKILERHDTPATLHYVDPPYMHDTRSTFKAGKQAYRHELDRGGARPPAEAAPHAHRHGGALRLPIRSLRLHAAGLATCRNRCTRRRRTSPHRSPLAQSSLCSRTGAGQGAEGVV